MGIRGPNFIPPFPTDLHITPAHKIYPEPKSTFGETMINLVRQVIGAKVEPKSNPQLLVDIDEVHSRSKKVTSYLEEVKVKVRETMPDGELRTQAETAIDLMIKEIARIHTLNKIKSPAKQEELLRKYFDWMENVRTFIHSVQEEGVAEAVRKQGIRSLSDIVSRDIDFLQRLQEHEMPQIASDVDRDQITKIFEVSISALEGLKPPDTLTLEQLSSWKVKLDAKRERYLNGVVFDIQKLHE